jgi:hypothetical protein
MSPRTSRTMNSFWTATDAPSHVNTWPKKIPTAFLRFHRFPLIRRSGDGVSPWSLLCKRSAETFCTRVAVLGYFPRTSATRQPHDLTLPVRRLPPPTSFRLPHTHSQIHLRCLSLPRLPKRITVSLPNCFPFIGTIGAISVSLEIAASFLPAVNRWDADRVRARTSLQSQGWRSDSPLENKSSRMSHAPLPGCKNRRVAIQKFYFVVIGQT